jgi:hypothetical protein
MNIDISKDIESIMFFGGRNLINSTGLVIKGNFKEELLKDYIEGLLKAQKSYDSTLGGSDKFYMENYMDHKIYKKSEKDAGGYVFIDKNLILAAPSSVLVKVVDLKVGWDNDNLEKTNSGLYNLVSRADDDMIFWLAVSVNERLKKSTSEYHDKLKTIDDLFLKVTLEGGIKVNISAGIKDKKARSQLADFFNQEINKFSGNEFFSRFLSKGQNLSVKMSNNGIELSFYIAIDTLAQIVEDIRKNFSLTDFEKGFSKEKKGGKTFGF